MTDTSGAIPEDDNDTVATAQDGGLDNSGVDVVQQVLDYGRQKYGLTQGGGDEGAGAQQAGYIPTIPAGPGGDRPGDPTPKGGGGIQNVGYIPTIPAGPGGDRPGDPTPKGRPQPQAIQQPGMPVFGKRTSMSFDDGGPVEDGAIPEDVDRASNVGNRQINDMADSAASDVGSALKGAGSAVMGALAPQGAAEANASTANDGVGDAMTALADGAQQSGGAGPAIPDGNGDPNMGPGASESASGSKNLLTYMTADAAPPHAVAQAEAAVDPHGQMREGDRKLAAIKAAVEQGGPEAGWSLVQANRQKFELLRQGAAAVLDGSDDKPGDLEHAAAVATKAFNHLPDGTNVTFHQEGNGVTATVTQGDKVLATQPLTTPQFRQFLRGGETQFDNAMNTSPAVLLQQVAKSQFGDKSAWTRQGHDQPQDQDAQAQGQGAQAQGQGAQATGQQQAGASKQAPSQDPVGDMSEIHNLREAEQAAARMFPNVGAMAERRAFVLRYMQEGGQKYPSEQRAAQARGDAMRDVAGLRVAGGIEREGVKQKGSNERNDNTNKVKERIATENQKNQRDITDSRNKASVQGRVISSLTPVNDKRLKQAQDAAGSVVPTRAPQTDIPQAQAPTSVPTVNQRQINQVYNTPNGPRRWMGNGWARVQ